MLFWILDSNSLFDFKLKRFLQDFPPAGNAWNGQNPPQSSRPAGTSCRTFKEMIRSGQILADTG
jgi:hypothetical protein